MLNAPYPSFLIDNHSVFSLAKDKGESPDIAGQNDASLDEHTQLNAAMLASSGRHIHLLLLSPELLKFPFFERVKVAILALAPGNFGLAQPFWIVAAVLKVELEYTEALPPIRGVSNE